MSIKDGGPSFTPGPWQYRPGIFDDWGVVRCDAGFICQARNPVISYAQEQACRSAKTDPAEANARLISAAPDMYEALDAIVYWHEMAGHVDESWIDAARAALEKARGK